MMGIRLLCFILTAFISLYLPYCLSLYVLSYDEWKKGKKVKEVLMLSITSLYFCTIDIVLYFTIDTVSVIMCFLVGIIIIRQRKFPSVSDFLIFFLLKLEKDCRVIIIFSSVRALTRTSRTILKSMAESGDPPLGQSVRACNSL